jgi:amino acid adenylation domain-containing protein
MFARSATAHPLKQAVVDERTAMSYRDLAMRIAAMESTLQAAGVARSMICLLLPAGIAYVAAVMAITGVRSVFAPIDPEWPVTRAHAAVEMARPAALITTEELRERALTIVAGMDVKPIVMTMDAGTLRHSDLQPRRRDPINTSDDWRDDSLYLIYTSGTTGEPNAVEGRHGSLVQFISWQGNAYQVPDTCRVSQLAPTTFDVHLRDVFLPLSVGGTIVVPDLATRRNPVRLASWLRQYEINLMHIVPSLFKVLVEAAEHGSGDTPVAPFAATVFFSGERFYSRDAVRFRRALPKGVRMVNFYGPSECTLIKTHYQLPDDDSLDSMEVVPLGWPIDRCEVVVCDAERPCQTGEIGEIRLRSKYLAKGYLGNSALTAERFVVVVDSMGQPSREYRTGDLGFMDESGRLHFIGRRDHQVKVNGNRVELGEVERRVRDVPGVRDAIVVMAEQPGQAGALACVYVAEQEIAPAEIRRLLGESLPRYMIPVRFFARRELPLSPNGKLDRRSIERWLADPATETPEESLHG